MAVSGFIRGSYYMDGSRILASWSLICNLNSNSGYIVILWSKNLNTLISLKIHFNTEHGLAKDKCFSIDKSEVLIILNLKKWRELHHLVYFQDPLILHLGCTMVKWQEFIQLLNHENNLQVYFKVKFLLLIGIFLQCLTWTFRLIYAYSALTND